jgi:hypothetical protein
MSPLRANAGIMSASFFADLHAVQYNASAAGTMSATKFPTKWSRVAGVFSSSSRRSTNASLKSTSTHAAQTTAAIQVCRGTDSPRNAFAAKQLISGPVARMASTDAMNVRFAATMKATF